jgi:acyl carrier protein
MAGMGNPPDGGVPPSPDPRNVRARLFDVIARQTGVSPARLTDDTALAGDLGVAGLDGADLLDAVGREFGVDLSVADWPAYFGEELPFDPLAALWRCFERLHRGGAPKPEVPELRVRDLLRSIERGEWSPPTE